MTHKRFLADLAGTRYGSFTVSGTLINAGGVSTGASSVIDFGGNTYAYQDGTGPYFVDFNTGNTAIFNLQTLSTNRTYTFPNASGTFAFLASPAFSGTPTAPTPATSSNSTAIATTAFVQSLFDLQNFKPAAYASTVTALPSYTYANGASGVGATITGVGNGPLTVDGVALVSGENVLVKNETSSNAPYNGLYAVTQTGVAAVSPFILSRNQEMDSAGEFVGALVPILNGSTLSGQTWQCSTAPTTVGTDNVTFTVYAGAGGGVTLAQSRAVSALRAY